jgi:hypothetical protein
MEQQIENLTYGTEIECLIPVSLTVHELAAQLTAAGAPTQVQGYNHNVTPGWKIVTDGSLTRAPGFAPYELVSPILRGDDGLEQIRKVSAVLIEKGCRVNRSCGLHVHVGARDRQLPWFKNLLRLYAQFEPVIDSFLAASRRGAASNWCQPVRYQPSMDQATNLDQLRRAYGLSRYRKLNLESFGRHGTVEFRHHQGTIEATKIINWVLFCLKLAATAEEPPTPVERGRVGQDRIIRRLVNRNPKRYGSSTWQRFERYAETGITVAEAFRRGMTQADLRWDVAHGFIRIEDGSEGQPEGLVINLTGLMATVKATTDEAAYFAERTTTLARGR